MQYNARLRPGEWAVERLIGNKLVCKEYSCPQEDPTQTILIDENDLMELFNFGVVTWSNHPKIQHFLVKGDWKNKRRNGSKALEPRPGQFEVLIDGKIVPIAGSANTAIPEPVKESGEWDKASCFMAWKESGYPSMKKFAHDYNVDYEKMRTWSEEDSIDPDNPTAAVPGMGAWSKAQRDNMKSYHTPKENKEY